MSLTTATDKIRTRLGAEVILPNDPRIRRGSGAAQRHDRQASGGDRALRIRHRHRDRSGVRADVEPRDRSPRGRSQRPRFRLRRGRPRHRPVADEPRRRRSRPAHRPGPGRRDMGPGGRRDPRARSGDADWHHLHHRRRRPHPGRRPRLPDPQARPDHRQSAGGRGRAGRRSGGDGIRIRARRPVLGAARRRRKLRRGHLVHVPPASGAHRDLRSHGVARIGHHRHPSAGTGTSCPLKTRICTGSSQA